MKKHHSKAAVRREIEALHAEFQAQADAGTLTPEHRTEIHQLIQQKLEAIGENFIDDPEMGPGIYITPTLLAKQKQRQEPFTTEKKLLRMAADSMDLRRDFRDLPECFEGFELTDHTGATIATREQLLERLKEFENIVMQLHTFWG